MANSKHLTLVKPKGKQFKKSIPIGPDGNALRPRGRPRKNTTVSSPLTYRLSLLSGRNVRNAESSTPASKPQARLPKPKRRDKRGTSHLERLPVELLERVLLDSLNFNLPLTSKILLAKLSRNKNHLNICAKIMYPGVEGEVMLQNSVLRRRFFDISYYRRLLQRLEGGDEAASLTTPEDGSEPFINFAKGTTIPNRALQYPFLGSAEIVGLLLKGGVIIDFEGSVAGETATKGIGQAIEHGDLQGVMILGDTGIDVTADLVLNSLEHAKTAANTDDAGSQEGKSKRIRIAEYLLNKATTQWSPDKWREHSLWIWTDKEKQAETKETHQFNIGYLFSRFLTLAVEGRIEGRDQFLEWFTVPHSIKTISLGRM